MELKMRLPHFEPLAKTTGWLGRAMARRRARHQAQQLKGMSEYELIDLGIGRSEVPALLRETADAPRTRRSAWTGHAGS